MVDQHSKRIHGVRVRRARYVILILEIGSISIKLSEYRVLCIHAIEQAPL